MSRLYLTPTPNATADRASDSVASAIEQAGLIDTSGVSTENIATENVDLSLRGRVQYGEALSGKLAAEMESLAESAYVAVPFVDDEASSSLSRKRGYYEVERADVTPAHPVTQRLFEYDLGLTLRGTRADHRRAVKTEQQAVDSLVATQTDTLVGIPGLATNVEWFQLGEGTEPASVVDTVSSEFGPIDRYDITEPSFTSPTVLYELPLDAEGFTDVRVWDTRGRDKFADVEAAETVASGETLTVASGETRTDTRLVVESGGTLDVQTGGTHVLSGSDSVTVWAHAYHPGFDFEGEPVIDNGRLRVYLGDAPPYNDLLGIGAEEWDGNSWARVTFDNVGWAVQRFELVSISPAQVRFRLFLVGEGTSATVDGRLDRGAAGVLWTVPTNEPTPPQGAVDLLDRIARDSDTAVVPEQSVIAADQTRD